MQGFFLLISITALLLAAPFHSVAAAVSITLSTEAIVSAEDITLSDVAVLHPDNAAARTLGQTIIAPSPAPGGQKQLDPAAIRSTVQSVYSGMVDWQGAPTVTVTRQAIRIQQKQLQGIIIDYLEQHRKKLPQGEVRFTSIRSPSEILLPYGEVSWRVTPSRPDIVSSSSFSIFFKVDGQPTHNCTVRGKVEIMAPVAVARETIRRGTIITRDAISMSRHDITRLRHPVTAANELIGMQAASTLRAGRAIEQTDITFPPIIEEGELVKIKAVKGNLRITTNGIAKASGRTGDVIRVKNISSNKLIYARVYSPGIVTVEF